MIVADNITINFDDGSELEHRGIVITNIDTIFDHVQSLVNKPISSLVIVLVKPQAETSGH